MRTADPTAVEALAKWARALAERQAHPRQNVRILFAGRAVAEAVQAQLSAASGPDAWYIVRKSADEDAVRLRHGRPHLERPAGVTDDTPVLYLVFWIPSEQGHADNAQSLADLRGVGLQELLADPAFVLTPEELIDDRCREAAAAWGDHREHAAAHLTAAWTSVRTVLRQGRGGREHSLPFISRLEDYTEYLREACGSEAEWQAQPERTRASWLVQKWGSALPALEMFRITELASLLKIVVEPTSRPGSKPRMRIWSRQLEAILAENLDAASDHGNLAETIKGKGALDEQLERLAKKSALSRTNAEGAREALARFLHERELGALREVEWLFKSDPANLRSESKGLKGLLIARRTRSRTSPLDRAADETQQLLEKEPANLESDVAEGFVDWCRARVKASGTRPERAQEIADALRAIGRGALPNLPVDAKTRDVLTKVTTSEPEAAAFGRVARLWERVAGSEKNATVPAPSLMLGLAHLLRNHLLEDDVGSLVVEPRPAPGDQLQLVVEVGGKQKKHLVNPAVLHQPDERERLREWLQAEVYAKHEDDDDNDREVDEQAAEVETDDIEVSVHRFQQGKASAALGVIELSWPATLRKIVERTNSDAPRSWKYEPEEDGGVTARDALAAFPRDGQSDVVYELPGRVLETWKKVHEATRTDGDWARAFVAGPLPAAVKPFVDAYLDELEGEPAMDPAQLLAEINRLTNAGKHAEAQILLTRHAGGGATGKTPTQLRALLRAWTGARWGHTDNGQTLPQRLYLTPFHPMVLRARFLGEELLGQLIRNMWATGWPAVALSELDAVLQGWGLPEPVHCYGGFYDGPPLVFDSWIGSGGVCAYAPFASESVRDHKSLGLREAAQVVRRYLSLHAAAGDTLRLRVQGDRRGEWAASLLRRLIQKLPADTRCDLDLITDLDGRTPTAVDVLATQRSDVGNALEMSDDGTRPRFRYRRLASVVDAGWAHLSLVLAPSLGAFQPKLETVEEPKDADYGVWDPAVLFALPRGERGTESVHMGLPRDEAALRVAKAIARGQKGGSGIYVERFSFDPAVIGDLVQAIHRDVHWTVMVARQPVHLAMKAVGSRAAELLDFGSSYSRGRLVHHCVSAGAHQFDTDLSRLTAMLQQLLGDASGDDARAVVREARSFAPGLAMQCASSGTISALQGLLGLLLTRRAMNDGTPGLVTIALDQHTGLLRGSGKRGDVLGFRLDDGVLSIRVGEAKLSLGPASAASHLVANAKVQLGSTLERAHHLGATHPLEARARNVLIQTLLHHIEMSDAAGYADDILKALLDDKTAIELEELAKCEVHAWGLEAGEDRCTSQADEPRCYVHSERSTRAAIDEILHRI